MNRLVRIAGMVLIACAMSGAWAQPGQGGARGGRDADPRQSESRRADSDRERDRGMSKEDRDQLRRDIREHGRDVYRDRDRGSNARSRRDARPQR